MSDYYDGIDKEGEKRQREMDKCYTWWDSLNDEEQYNLMYDYYCNTFTEDDYANDFFDELTSEDKLWIYQRENKLTEEDLEGQADRAGDMEYEEKKIRGDDNDD